LTRFITDIYNIIVDETSVRFGQEFRVLGHVILLNGARGGLSQRQGSMELPLELQVPMPIAYGRTSTVESSTLCEILNGITERALDWNYIDNTYIHIILIITTRFIINIISHSEIMYSCCL